jgi:UDP-GlcNAc:polypeptide alpha-N-acetylglucosaminyltransferase
MRHSGAATERNVLRSVLSFTALVLVLVVLGVALHRSLSMPAALRRHYNAVGASPPALSDEVAVVSDRINAVRQRIAAASGGKAEVIQVPDTNVGASEQRRGARMIRRAALGSLPKLKDDVHVQHPHTVSRDDSIFVSIASYRDLQCAPTIYDMYARAKNPHALFIGIVEQHNPKQDLTCMPAQYREAACQLQAFCPSDNIQTRFILPEDARGPTYGRYIGMLMYRGEKYYMMIDSHNRFVTHWDNILVNMYKNMPSPDEKRVLSHYPEAWYNPDDGGPKNKPLDGRRTTTYLCRAKFVPDLGYVKLDGIVYPAWKQPKPQAWAAAGFLFADAALIREVPFDPYLDFVFDGEEILYSARMWTHGWNIYSPSESILFHYYGRMKAKKFWSQVPRDYHYRRDAAHKRIQRYLQTVKINTHVRMVSDDIKEPRVVLDYHKYGMGHARTLDQWYDYAGIDKVKQTLKAKFC